MNTRPMTVEIETSKGAVLAPALVALDVRTNEPLRWNGWIAEPYFTRETIDALARKLEGETRIEWRNHTVVTFDEDGCEQTGIWGWELINGEQRWPVGAFAWCWREAAPADGFDPDKYAAWLDTQRGGEA